MIEARALMPPVPHGGKAAAVVLTILVHCILLLFLIYGVSWQTAPPESVSVALVRNVPLGPPTPVEEETAAPPPPVAEPVQEAEPKAEPHEASPAKPDIAIKEKPREKHKETPREQPKEKPKLKTKSDAQAPSYDPMQALRQETAQRSDAKLRNAAARDQAASVRGRALATYMGKIRDKIRGNIVVPPSVHGNPEAIFDIAQLPSGEIVPDSIRLRKSSGNPALDAAIERAIRKSSPLPQPDQPDLFQRNLGLTIKPLQD